MGQSLGEIERFDKPVRDSDDDDDSGDKGNLSGNIYHCLTPIS